MNKQKKAFDKLIEFINAQGKWQEDYMESCEDFKESYDYYLEDLAKDQEDFSHIANNELREFIELQAKQDNWALIFDHCTIELTNGYRIPDNAISCTNLGEMEVQISGLNEIKDSNDNWTCEFSRLIKDITSEELENINSKTDYYLKDDCIYFDPGMNISLIINEDSLKELLKEGA